MILKYYSIKIVITYNYIINYCKYRLYRSFPFYNIFLVNLLFTDIYLENLQKAHTKKLLLQRKKFKNNKWRIK